jgi:hypothetical protein
LIAAGSEIKPDTTVTSPTPWLLAKLVVEAEDGLVETDIVIVAWAVSAVLALLRPTGRRTSSEFHTPPGKAMSEQSTIVWDLEAGAVVVLVVL